MWKSCGIVLDLFIRGENFAQPSKDRSTGSSRKKEKFAAVIGFLFGPISTSKLSPARHSQVPGLLPLHFVEHISRSSTPVHLGVLFL